MVKRQYQEGVRGIVDKEPQVARVGSADSDRRGLRILMVGPLPPPQGGARVLFQEFVQELKSERLADVEVVRTWNPKSCLPRRVIAAAVAAWKILRTAGSCDVVAFWGSDHGTVLFSPVLRMLASITRTPWIIRLFGGSFDLACERAGPIQRAWIRKMLSSATLVMLETRYLVRYCQERFPSARVAWHSNGRQEGMAVGARQGPCRRFVYLGKVKKTKGVLDLAAAAERFPEGEVAVDVYGPFDEGLSALSFDAYRNTRYRGILASHEIRDTLLNYDALVLPTFYEGEGYPGVIIEAYAAGLPVIATDWRAIPEIVSEDCGILVPARDVDALFGAMKSLVDDVPRYRSLSEKALRRNEEFSLTRWAREFVMLCGKAVETR